MDDLIWVLHQYPLALIALIGLLGLLIGSFLNVVILRVPRMMESEWRQQCVEFLAPDQSAADTPTAPTDSAITKRFDLVFPASHCPACQHSIAAYDNIPVLSYLILRGRCRHCQQKISPRYAAIELLTGILSALVAWKFGLSWPMAAALFFTWTLVALTFIDIDHQLLPDSMTLPLVWIGLLLSLGTMFTDPRSAIIGAVAGYMSLWTIYQLFKLVTGKEGMGFGDFKLFAAFGAWMGWQSLPMIILLSSLVGAIIGITLIIVRGRDKNIPIPFGPYLAAAGWLALMWGDVMLDKYYHSFSTTL